jgi:pimeloyl-ACP methyl ester carboxylesterase
MKRKRFFIRVHLYVVLLMVALFAVGACALYEKIVPEQVPKKTFVLVHGAWHGGWVWERMLPYLGKTGYKIMTPTLTGLGEKENQATPEVGLNTHIQDILTLLEKENLRNVVLVGHSYGGMVIAGVADKMPERISHLVYLDAYVPKDGQSMGDFIGPQGMSRIREVAKSVGQGWRIPSFPVERFGITSEVDIAWVKPKLVPQPIKTFEEPVRLTNSAAASLRPTYIYLTKPAMATTEESQKGLPGTVFEGFAKVAKSSKDWGYYELETGHDAMVLEPQKLAELFIKIAEQSGKKRSTERVRSMSIMLDSLYCSGYGIRPSY